MRDTDWCNSETMLNLTAYDGTSVPNDDTLILLKEEDIIGVIEND